MRFSQYKNINEMIDSVIEATEYMISSCSSELCNICMQTLQSIKGTLELEENCSEILKMISTAIECFENEVYETDDLYSLLLSIREKAKTDISYKLRILFVAELGGKWDAMASAYEAFKNREDCEVDVVLEPIFREVTYSDGTTKKEIIYEDWLTPLGIKHILYSDYNMAVIKPDITFFSQPYETVTIPMFWPENMSKYTRVVYLPYFFPTTISDFSSFSGFFNMPTEKYSWKIAGASKRIKDYARLYGSKKGNNVITVGIPKSDYPIKLNKDNTPCPEKWKEKIKNRKVFLYGTHFSSFTSSQENFELNCKIVKYFLKNKDIALIWRPHPMTDTILKLYSPVMYEKYKELFKSVEKSSNIVIDNNSVYDYAFVWSDCLITFFSSLFDQYLLMNKPLAIIENGDNNIIKAKYYTTDKLFDYSKVTFLNSFDSVQNFIKSIKNNDDITKEGRNYLLENFYLQADGNAGKRVCETIILEFKKEELETVAENTEKVMIIGDVENSRSCASALKEKQIEFCFCGDIYFNQNYTEEVFPLDDISDDKFKYFIITDPSKVSVIFELLESVYNVDEKKIIDFWKIYNLFLPEMVCDRIMQKPVDYNYEGLILGISHSEVGLIAENFDVPFVNLALSSQDLYYQLKIFEYVVNHYLEKLMNLKYVIIDMFYYTYFNFDTSLSSSAVKYLSYGGYNDDEHNFSKNTLTELSYEQVKEALEFSKFTGVIPEQIKVWKELFDDIAKHTDYKGYNGNFDIKSRFRMVTDEDVKNYNYNGSAGKYHKETINENRMLIDRLFSTLKAFNPNLKIYTVILPKYMKNEVIHIHNSSRYIDEFNEIMNELHKKYDYTMLDLNKISDISVKKAYYYDSAHLNYFGAREATKIINNIIFGDAK